MHEQGAPTLRQKLLLRVLHRGRLTARLAAAIIAVYTAGIMLVGGAVARLVDGHDFHNFGDAVWWALQTVTTVGYGDIVPTNAPGRIVGGWLMVSGVAFLAVITASVAAALIETVRARSRNRTRELEEEISSRLASLEARFEKLDASLRSGRR